MDQRKKDLEKDLAPQINAGLVTVEILKDNLFRPEIRIEAVEKSIRVNKRE